MWRGFVRPAWLPTLLRVALAFGKGVRDTKQKQESPTPMTSAPEFIVEHHPHPVDAVSRAAMIEKPGFGTLFTDHMVTIRYTEGQGWHEAKIGPRGPLSLDPATAVLHYAQEIFEGLKAYRHADGSFALFRPEQNAQRFNRSAQRLAMPELPEDLFLASIEEIVRTDKAWMPGIEGGSLYIRPFMFASEAFLGVRPAKEYLYIVILSPAGAYFKSGAPAVKIWVSEDYSRAGPGGTGAAKCGGNYAASLLPQSEAIDKGCDQVVFLDAKEQRWIDELGGMNLFFLFDDGRMITPPLGTILPGITRDSIMQLARDEGIAVTEEPYAIDQWEADAKSGKLVETFACGTAAVVTPVGEVKGRHHDFTIGAGGPGQLTMKLRDTLTGIQRGTLPDPHGWVRKIARV